MKKTLAIFAATIITTLTLTSCSNETADDKLIKFGKDGNVYMPQSLCDRDPDEIDMSDDMEEKLLNWWNEMVAGEHDGQIICYN